MHNPFLKLIVEHANKEGLAAARAEGEARGKIEGKVEGLAAAIVKFAVARDVEVPDDFVETLAAHADEEQLTAMIVDLDRLTDDIEAFAKDHGVGLPGHRP